MKTIYRNHIRVEANELNDGDKVIIYENENDLMTGHSSLWLVEDVMDQNLVKQRQIRKIGGV